MFSQSLYSGAILGRLEFLHRRSLRNSWRDSPRRAVPTGARSVPEVTRIDPGSIPETDPGDRPRIDHGSGWTPDRRQIAPASTPDQCRRDAEATLDRLRVDASSTLDQYRIE